ncbi:MAG: hypothetical protein WBA51_03735 [Erythrobacter sp.]
MLIRKVEKFLREHEMSATKFGRMAAHDPRFVLDLRMGRTPRAATEARTLRWMASYTPIPPAPPATHTQTVALETKGFAHA